MNIFSSLARALTPGGSKRYTVGDLRIIYLNLRKLLPLTTYDPGTDNKVESGKWQSLVINRKTSIASFPGPLSLILEGKDNKTVLASILNDKIRMNLRVMCMHLLDEQKQEVIQATIDRMKQNASEGFRRKAIEAQSAFDDLKKLLPTLLKVVAPDSVN